MIKFSEYRLITEAIEEPEKLSEDDFDELVNEGLWDKLKSFMSEKVIKTVLYKIIYGIGPDNAQGLINVLKKHQNDKELDKEAIKNDIVSYFKSLKVVNAEERSPDMPVNEADILTTGVMIWAYNAFGFWGMLLAGAAVVIGIPVLVGLIGFTALAISRALEDPDAKKRRKIAETLRKADKMTKNIRM